MTPISFNHFNCPFGLIKKIKDGSIDLKKAKENQGKFKLNLNETIRKKWEHKSEEQKNTINNLKMFYKAKQKVFKLFDDYNKLHLRLNMKLNMENDSKY